MNRNTQVIFCAFENANVYHLKEVIYDATISISPAYFRWKFLHDLELDSSEVWSEIIQMTFDWKEI